MAISVPQSVSPIELPWFGEGKTTIRGGYQQTFQRILVNNSGEANGTDTFIGQIPGSQQTSTTAVSDPVFQNIVNPTSGTAACPQFVGYAESGSRTARNQPRCGISACIAECEHRRNLRHQLQTAVHAEYDSIGHAADQQELHRGSCVTRERWDGDWTTARIWILPTSITIRNCSRHYMDARAGTCTANAAGYKSYTDAGISPCDVAAIPFCWIRCWRD